MSLPTTPFYLIVEAFLNSGWRDISTDVRYRNGAGIAITHGLQDEAGVSSAQMEFVVDNNAGNYSSHNPTGQWYGSLKKNTRVRAASLVVTDLSVSRSATNGWGNASWVVSRTSAPLTWSTSGGVAGDYAVTAGVGTHRLTSTATRATYLPVALWDCEQEVTVQLPVPTGGPITVAFAFRHVTDHAETRLIVSPGGTVSAQFGSLNVGAIGAPVVVPGITFTGQPLRMRSHLYEGVFRVKIWDPAAGPEPYAWTCYGTNWSASDPAAAVGSVGVLSWKDSTNTNGTFNVSFSSYQVLFREFHGEISATNPQRDRSGRDVTTEFTAGGPSRRLRANTSTTARPIQSAAYYALRNAAGLVAYWPGEDASGADQLASYRPDWAPMTYVGAGTPSLGSNSKFLCSAPLPVIGSATLDGQITPYATPSPSAIQMRWLLNVDTSSGEPANDASVIRWYCTGSAAYWIIRYQTGGDIRIQVEDTTESPIFNTVLPAGINNRQLLCSLDAKQNGANIDWNFIVGEPNVTVPVWFGTINSQTLGMARSVTIGTDKNLNNVTIGHVTVQSQITSFFEFIGPLSGWRGESALSRIVRVSSEQGVPFEQQVSASVQMGPQPIASYTGIYDETIAVDQGLGYDSNYSGQVGYMPSGWLSGRPVHMSLDFANRELFDNLPVPDDDYDVINYVVAESKTGSTVTRWQSTGPLAATSPEEGGIGLYDKRFPVNTNTINQTGDLAGYLLFAGTINLPRIPQATLWLHNPSVFADLRMVTDGMQLCEGKVITLDNLPKTMASDSLRETVIGYKKRLTQVEYAITVNCAAGEKYQVATVDDLGVRAEAGAAFLSADITNSATTVIVKSLDNTTFTTDSADYPYDITLGGERIRFNAPPTGSTSPQTFNGVTRSINGVVKAHTADDTEQARVTIVSHSVVALA